jgi:YfiH family protein
MENVLENRRRTFSAFGRSPDSIHDVWQVHSAVVAVANGPRLANQPHMRADAIITDRPGVTLFMRFADCTPICLFDPVRRVIGLVHAGWRGTVRKVGAAAVAAMQTEYGVRPENILAGIGPTIGPDHYQVGSDVVEQMTLAFGADASRLIVRSENDDPGVKLDLWAANRLTLQMSGVRHIETAEICTACATQDWFSHRAEAGKTGRFGAILAL